MDALDADFCRVKAAMKPKRVKIDLKGRIKLLEWTLSFSFTLQIFQTYYLKVKVIGL